MKRSIAQGEKKTVCTVADGLTRERRSAMTAGLTPAAGIRRGDFDGLVCFAYRKGCGSTAETARRIRPLVFTALTVAEEEIDGAPFVIECYRLASEMAVRAKISAAGIAEAYTDLTGSAFTRAAAELFRRLDWRFVDGSISAVELAVALEYAETLQRDGHIRVSTSSEDGEYRLTVARNDGAAFGALVDRIAELVASAGFRIRRGVFLRFNRDSASDDFARLPVETAQLLLDNAAETSVAERLKELAENCRLLAHAEFGDLHQRELVECGELTWRRADLARAVEAFLRTQFSFVDRHVYTQEKIRHFLCLFPELLNELCDLFEAKFDPRSKRAGCEAKRKTLAARIAALTTGIPANDRIARNVFAAALDFIDNIQLTNYFTEDKAALAFRVDTRFLDFYGELSPEYPASFPADRPASIFFFYRADTLGFMVCFDACARGGWRSVVPKFGAGKLERLDPYEVAKDEIFREVYVLAHTQHLKNKDIYEGGSKTITLLRPREGETDFHPRLWESQRAVTSALMSLVNYDDHGRLRDRKVVDTLHHPEIIEIGPDENMSDVMIEWIGEYARRSGYALGSGLISGKPGSGFNHKALGVTSYGVYQYLLATADELGIKVDSEPWSVKISGGPNGDVAGNIIKLLNRPADSGHGFAHPDLKIVGIVDGPAAAADPTGLDREELLQLVAEHRDLDGFDPEKLRGDGACIIYTKPIVDHDVDRYRMLVRRNGRIEEKLLPRDEFLQRSRGILYLKADIFIPCGGRPSTIDLDNCDDYSPRGVNSSRAIVEGANSFITPRARKRLQERGILIIKDASANKCGVITSSYEILSGLMLDDSEFNANKEELVRELMVVLRRRARNEANWLYSHFHSDGVMLTELTERLSRAINAKNVELRHFLEEHPQYVTDEVILAHLLPLFTTKFRKRLTRIPASYRRAIVSVELASRIVYSLDDLNSEIRAVL